MPAKKIDFNQQQSQLNADLKAEKFAPVYLICGEQAYLRLQNRDKVVQALLGGGDEMNLSRFAGTEVDVKQIIELAETLPFLAERRVIVLEDTALFGTGASADSDELAAYLPRVPETTHFVFVQEEVDKRKRLYRACSKQGVVFACENLTEQTLRRWAGGLFRHAGLAISGSTLAAFLNSAGEDMFRIRSEAEKLIAYCQGKTQITIDDVEAVCVPQIRDRIFDMITAIAQKDRTTALRIYMDLLALQTTPQAILTLMERQYNQLILASEMAGASDSEIAQAVKVPLFAVGKRLRPLIRRYSADELLRALQICLEADEAGKDGTMDAGIALECAMAQLTVRERT